MATRKLTIKRGQTSVDVVVAAGSAISSETIELGMDLTSTSQREFLVLIDELKKAVIDSDFLI